MNNFSKYLAGGLVVVIAFALGVAALRFTGSDNSTGAYRPVSDSYVNGIGIGDLQTKWEKVTLNAGSNQGSWQNTESREIFVDVLMAWNTVTATSTFTFDVATSTGARISDNYADPNGTLIDARVIATSTPANTTYTNVGNALARRERIRVAAGEYLNFIYRAPANCVSGLAATAGAPGKCAAATSTGALGDLNVQFHYTFTK